MTSTTHKSVAQRVQRIFYNALQSLHRLHQTATPMMAVPMQRQWWLYQCNANDGCIKCTDSLNSLKAQIIAIYKLLMNTLEDATIAIEPGSQQRYSCYDDYFNKTSRAVKYMQFYRSAFRDQSASCNVNQHLATHWHSKAHSKQIQTVSSNFLISRRHF